MMLRYINPRILLGTPIENHDYVKLRQQGFTETIRMRIEVEVRIENMLNIYTTNQR